MIRARPASGIEVGSPPVAIAIGELVDDGVELVPAGSLVVSQPRGWYFTISTKLSSLFDLFGTSPEGLAPADGPKSNT